MVQISVVADATVAIGDAFIGASGGDWYADGSGGDYVILMGAAAFMVELSVSSLADPPVLPFFVKVAQTAAPYEQRTYPVT